MLTTFVGVGAKHWPKQHADQLWSWITTRLDRIYAQMKPDTVSFWENLLSVRHIWSRPATILNSTLWFAGAIGR